MIGIGFHLGCGIVMGLNSFVWAFGATYPAVVLTNGLIRSTLGAPLSTAAGAAILAVGVLAVGLAMRSGFETAAAGQRRVEVSPQV